MCLRSIFTCRNESEEDGFVIDKEEVGLRLKVFEYWKCAETGLTSDAVEPNTIKFVLAESLPGQGMILKQSESCHAKRVLIINFIFYHSN